MNRLLIVIAAACVASCGSSSSPTAPTVPTVPSTPTNVSLAGTAVNPSGQGIVGARIQILDGANAGKSTTTITGGTFRFDGLLSTNANLSATANCYQEARAGVFINGTNTATFTLPFAAPFAQSGSGNDVFDVPTCVSRIHITGTFSGFTSNFIVRIGGSLVVNDLIGTAWGTNISDGTYLTSGGTAQITNSQGVAWSFTQVR